MIKQLYWSANGPACTFIGVWRPSGKLEIEYWFDGGQAWLTLKKRAKSPKEANEYFEKLLAEINQFKSVAHWLGNNLLIKGGVQSG